MKVSQTLRRAATLLAITSVLFNQLAIADYACPDFTSSGRPDAVARTAWKTAAKATPCDKLDPASPNLCLQHWKNDKQSLDHPEVPVVAPILAVRYFVTRSDPTAPQARAEGVVQDFLAHEIGPPLAVQYCCFRI